MSTHSHSAHNPAGSSSDKKYRGDSNHVGGNAVSTGIGHPFTPMVSTAPVRGMSTPHFTTSCPSCSVPILWAYRGGDGVCGGCGIGLTTHPDNGHPVVA